MSYNNDNHNNTSPLSGIRKAIPVVLCALGAFVAFCFITAQSGAIGSAVSGVLFGLFSNGAYAIPPLLILHGIFFSGDVAKKRVGARAVFSLVAVVCVSMISYAVFHLSLDIKPAFTPESYYAMGMAATGGGVIGSILAYGLIKVISAVGLIILSGIFLIIDLACFFSDSEGIVGNVGRSVITMFASVGAFIERGVKKLFYKVTNIKTENERRLSVDKSRELADDEFFMVDNGMQDFEISELGIKETRETDTADEAPMLHDKVRLKSSVSEDDEERSALHNVRIVEEEIHSFTPQEEEKPRKRKMFRVDVELDESVNTDDSLGEENVIYDEPVNQPPLRDDSADSVFTKDFDPFNVYASEKLAAKQSSRSRTNAAPKKVYPTSSDDISAITHEDVERARKQAEFDMKKRSLLDSYAKKEAQSGSTAPEVEPTPVKMDSEPQKTESYAFARTQEVAEEERPAYTSPAAPVSREAERADTRKNDDFIAEFNFEEKRPEAEKAEAPSSSVYASASAVEYSFTAPVQEVTPAVSEEFTAPVQEAVPAVSEEFAAPAQEVAPAASEEFAAPAQEAAPAASEEFTAPAQEAISESEESTAAEFDFEEETPHFEENIPPVVVEESSASVESAEIGFSFENVGASDAEQSTEAHDAFDDTAALQDEREQDAPYVTDAGPITAKEEPEVQESVSMESANAPIISAAVEDTAQEDAYGDASPTLTEEQSASESEDAEEDEPAPSEEELLEGAEDDSADEEPQEIPLEEQNPKISEYRNMFPILDEEETEDEDGLVFEHAPEVLQGSDFEEITFDSSENEDELETAELTASDEQDHTDSYVDSEEIYVDAPAALDSSEEEMPNGESSESEDESYSSEDGEDEPPFDVEEPHGRQIYIEEPTVEEEPPKPKKPDYSNYKFPPIDILAPEDDDASGDIQAEIEDNANTIIETLKSFKAPASIKGVDRGPRITRYEIVPSMGIKTSSIMQLQNDLALNLAAEGIRMEAPIPGKSAIGLEIPNRNPSTVRLRALLETEDFINAKSKTTVCIGKDVSGCPVFGDIAKMPHVLIAGATGMGKSVCINSIMISMLYKARPDEVKFIMIDPKKVEFTMYNGIPHLLIPVVTDPKQAAGALMWAVEQMEKRYEMIEKMRVRNIEMYNDKVAKDPTLGEPMSKIIVVIDELNDLMLQVRDPVEGLIMSIAQKARAAGIHLIIGTQRPSVDVITGVIKANIPSRISCKVMSNTDSRTVLDQKGAEDLLDKGDMLFYPAGKPKPARVQGAFVSDGEVEEIMEFLKSQGGEENYDSDVMEEITRNAQKCNKKSSDDSDDGDSDGEDSVGFLNDQKFLDAVNVAVTTGKISTSLLQRKLSIGYGKAAKYVDTMEDMGIVSEINGSKARDVLITRDEWHEKLARLSLDD
ncbi:MAG: hypothetical protein IKB38_10560 [Clostridia bacterium]|nr:hypothetical protein [Clostridia bacterium]